MAVLGEVGTGKSSLVSYLAWQCLQELERLSIVPLHCRLKDTGTQPSGKWGLPWSVPEGWSAEGVEAFLNDGSCLLLLDGFDELREECREDVLDAIRRFVELYPSHYLVLTSRPDALSPQMLHGPFSWVKVAALDSSRVKRWVQRHYRVRNRGRSRALLGALGSGEYIFAEPLPPLLLKAVANALQEGLKPDLAHHQLCYRCFHLLLEDWNSRKGIASIFLLDHKLRILQAIALWLLREEGTEADVQEIIHIASVRGKELGIHPQYIPSLLEEIARRNGVLVEERPGVLGFAQSWMQRYLASRELLEEAAGAEEFLEHVGESVWETTCAYYANQTDVTYLVGLLQGLGDPFEQHLLLAGRCVAVAPRIAPPMARQVVRQLIALCQASPFEPVVARAYCVLLQIASEEALRFLRDAFQRDEGTRRRIASALSEQPAAEFAPLLAQNLRDRASKEMRILAAEGLANMGTREAFGALEYALEDPSWEVRTPALDGLGWSGQQRLVPTYVRFLTEGYWSPQKHAACRLHGLFGSLPGQILKQAAEDKSDSIRFAAAQGLANVGTADAREALGALTRHPNAIVRLWAACGRMMQEGNGEDVRLLQDMVLHPDESVRYSLVSVLIFLGDHHLPASSYLEMGQALLADSAWRVRGAMLADWRLDTDVVLPRIEELVDDPIAYVHVRAVRALGVIRREEVTGLLLGIFRNARFDGQILAACQSLHCHRCSQAESLVLDKLRRGHGEQITHGLLHFLVDLGSPQAFARLAELVDHRNDKTRSLAFEACRKISARHRLAPPAALVGRLHDLSRLGGGPRCEGAEKIG